MVKLLVGGKEYFGAKEIAERLVKDIEEEQVGIVYRFLGLDDADEEEIEKLNHIYMVVFLLDVMTASIIPTTILISLIMKIMRSTLFIMNSSFQ